MKFQRALIRGFLGARDIDIAFGAPIVVVCGENESGKSSTHEAINLAATGEMARVKLKNEYHEVVSDGAGSGHILLETSEGAASFEVPTGKWGEHKALNTAAMRYCLNAHRFASLDETERRRFLFGLTGTKLSRDEIARRLGLRGIAEAIIPEAVALAERGLDVATKECAKAATERKGSWREVTSETWGASKGGAWRATVPDFDEDAYQTLVASVTSQRATLDAKRTELGRIQNRVESVQRDSRRLAELRAKIANRGALETERSRVEDERDFVTADLDKATAELNEIAAQYLAAEQQRARPARRRDAVATTDAPPDLLLDAVTPLRGLVAAMSQYPGGIAYRENGGPLEAYGWETFDFADQASEALRRFEAAYPDYAPGAELPIDIADEEPEVRVESPSRRDVLSAKVQQLDAQKKVLEKRLREIATELGSLDAYQAQITELEIRESGAEVGEGLDAAQREVEALAEALEDAEEELARRKALRGAVETAKQKTRRAAELHAAVLAWDACAKALAPDGIPAEIVAESLGPVNEGLAVVSQQSGWPPVTIDAAMTIRYGGRRYELLAESGKWRADACIAEVIAVISGTRFIMLDRIDVNSIPNRQKLLRWLGTSVRSGRLEGACLLGTLKQPPTGLPETLYSTAWLEQGRSVPVATAPTTH